jgi:hypothetical protein
MSNEKQARFIPFHAINEFMLPEYRLKLVQEVFGNFDRLSEERQSAINRLVKKLVKVAGFRNSTLAPAALKSRASVSAFERSPEMVAQICQAWFELHTDLAAKVVAFLQSRGWEVLPVEADRAVLPGFLTRWPEKDNFVTLDDAFAEAYPEETTHGYDLNMMIVWVSGRLPVELVAEESENLPSEE